MDGEPYAQRVRLDCGDWFVFTYGSGADPMKRGDKPFTVGEKMRCRTCGVQQEYLP